MATYRLSIGLVLLLAAPIAAQAADAPAVTQIRIHGQWFGMGTPQDKTFVVERKGGGYARDGMALDGAAVDGLMSALRAPAIEAPDLANLGIDQAWLDSHVSQPGGYLVAWPDNPPPDPAKGAPNQLALYHARFTDPKFMRDIVASVFDGMHTDDYPRETLAITLGDKSVVTLDSKSQHPFMLPWTVTRNGQTVTTYDVRIARAILALLPADDPNRGRIEGGGLFDEIQEAFSSAITPEWRLLDVENRAGPALATLRVRYTVAGGEISDVESFEYGLKRATMKPGETNLLVTLHRPDLPESFADELVLPYRDGAAEGMDRFLRDAPAYEALALSVPWLASYLRTHPKMPVHLSYVHDASLNDKAMRAFTADMHVLGKDALAAEVRAEQNQAVLLLSSEGFAQAFWLILPDRRMVLWRYSWPEGLLKWKPGDVRTKPCDKDYVTFAGGCVGAIVSPEGVLTN